MQMKSEHLIHIEAKSEHQTVVLANVMQMKSEHLIHIKAKSERLTVVLANVI